MSRILAVLALSMNLGLWGCATTPQAPRPAEAATTKSGEAKPLAAPLFDDLGSHSHPITTSSALAQRYFNQGLTLVYAFNHGEAIRSFQAAATSDPSCAMAYWGIALALGPNINAPMPAEAVPKAYEALQLAQKWAGKASEKEQAYIAALATRYAEKPTADRSALDRAYADAMRALSKRYPGDLDAATLFAEAVMDTMPWRYWTKENTPKPATTEVIAVLESVLSRSPNHPGANHYYIHAIEAGPEPRRALASADRLRTLVPGAGHLVHMPSHIYVRVGLYHEASYANERAIEADESYLSQCNAQGFYPANYYPHNLHFLWYTKSMEGLRADAIKAARSVAAHASHGQAVKGEMLRPLPLMVLARFGRWDEILKEPRPAASARYELAMSYYARGVALAAKGQGESAAREQASLQQLVNEKDKLSFADPDFPGATMLSIANEALLGEIAMARGEHDRGIQHLAAAVRLEDELPYMEPPYWFFPVRHSMGAALLTASRPAEAEAVYRADLQKNPDNGWSLFGLAQSLRAQGKNAQADEVQRQFQLAWIRADKMPTSSRY